MRICITRSSRNAYSETFIRDQIEGFSKLADVYTIYSGRLPEKQEDGKPLNSGPFRLMHKIVKGIVGRNNFFGDYGVKKYLKDNKIEVVLANYGMPAAHMVSVCKSLNIPLLVIFHGHDATDKKLLKEYYNKYQKLFNYASFLLPVSEDLKSGLIAIGATPEKIKVIPCGVDITKFKPGINSPKSNFIAVGRFTEKKGPLHTIGAFYKVLKLYPKTKLIMVGGKSSLFEKCENLVKKLNISDSVIFTGILNSDEIADLMRSSLAFVQHSITAPNGDTEGTPVGVLEASASGLPVVSTLHGGIKEAVLHGKTGFLVEEKDENGMAEFMIQLLENPEMAKDMGINGRNHIVENYYQENQIKKIYELAKEAIGS
ncbi:glycosyltransferase family 4 protein [Flavobacterium sp.]|uniref:glycosyltransferase family 4 protein n=1 Tax=Flavobacterium sp. TaxID=239 RepID=UPI002489D600|nr:glycosyltransferase family 4 protein [Flavobacterium sp.]MDI1317121.1 glycosyltransferase family 4 protein [Flavobacterium sp.]